MDGIFIVPVTGDWDVIEPHGNVGRVIAWVFDWEAEIGARRAYYVEPAGSLIHKSSEAAFFARAES